MKTGPNVRKLIAGKVSVDAIPKGGGVQAGIEFLLNAELVRKTLREACHWTEGVLAAIRAAAEPNPWKAAEDEAVAGEILARIAEKRRIKGAQDVVDH